MLNFANQQQPSAGGGFPPTVWASRAWNFVVSNQIKVQRTTATIAKPDRVSFRA